MISSRAMGEDKRQFTRYPANFQVICRGKGQQYDGCTINISRGGLLISTAEVLPVGQVLEISFDLPGAGPIAFKTLVRHASSERGSGVEFVEALPRYQQALAAYLDALEASCRSAATAGN